MKNSTARTAVAVACVAFGAAPVAARAGQPVTNGTDTLQIEAAVHAATTAPHGKPRPVALDLTLRYFAVSGGPATPPRTGGVDLPTGMNVNLEPRPKCRLSGLVLHGVNGCSRQSRIGAGTAVLDGRAAGRGYPLRARVRVFSALWDVPPPPPGFPPPHVFVAYASAPDAGLFIGMGNNPRFDRSALGVYGGGILGMPVGMAVEELNLTFRSMRWPRAEGAKPLIQAPTRWPSSWRFTAAYQFVRFGPRLTATDDVPCREKR